MITVSNGGVTVEKQYHSSPNEAIEYRITSSHSESVKLTLVETLPGHVDPGDIGVLPDSKQHWKKRTKP